MSKLGDEIDSGKKKIISFFSDWKSSIELHAPRPLLNLIDAVVRHPGTPWFFLGSALEALGLVIQFQLFGASYPIMDFMGGTILFIVIVALQRKPEYAPIIDDDEDEEEDDGDDDPET
jgi:hypothetical protein